MKGVWFRALGSGFGLPSWRLTLNPKPPTEGFGPGREGG